MRLKILNPDNTGLTQEMICERESRMKSVARPDTEISMECQSKTHVCVESAVDIAVTSLELIEKAIDAEKNGYDAIGLYCAEDPAIDAVREAVSIPVVGGGQSSLQIAIGLGSVFSWISSSENTTSVDYFIRRSGVDYTRLSSIRSVVVEIASPKTLDRQSTMDRLTECGRKCITEDGTHLLILGCLAFAGMGAELSRRLGVPVIDPALSIVTMAELLCCSGLTHSKLTYPIPKQQKRSWTGGELFL